MKNKLTRRSFLGSSAACLSGPWMLDRLCAASTETSSPRRLVCVGLDLSLRPENFFPSTAGTDYEITPLLQPVERWQGRMSVLSQLDHPDVSGGHSGVHAFLSGIRREQAAGFPDGNLSLDQLAAEQMGHETRFASLCLGTGGDPISWTRAGIAMPTITSPRRIFDTIFRPRLPAERDSQRSVLRENKLVSDLVRADAARMRPRLDLWDREKMDEFVTSLHEFESKLTRKESWLDRPRPTTTASPPDESAESTEEYLRAFYDVMTLALQCDATRFVTFNIGSGLKVANQIPDVRQGYHDLSHSGQHPEKLAQLHMVENMLMQELDRFLGRLASLRDGAGESLLDNTVVLFGSGMGNASSHSNRNLPILVAGGGLKHGRHLFFEKQGRDQTPLCNLYVTLLQYLGLEIEQFGTSDGDLNELLT